MIRSRTRSGACSMVLSQPRHLRWLVLAISLCTAVQAGAQQASNCTEKPPLSMALTEYSTGWGIDARNTRFQPRSNLDSTNVSRLKLKWSYALGSDAPRSYPLITADTIYIGSDGQGLLALDRQTGCERWRFEHDGPFGSAILPGRAADVPMLVFANRTNGIYAVDARDGTLLWHTRVTDEPVPWYSGTPLVAGDKVYVPISSLEVGLAVNPLYGCCTTSGGMAALDLATGRQLWYVPTISEPAHETGSHYWLVSHYGPSGAAVWGAPSLDQVNGRLYFGTGQNYSHPTTDTSDAIFAVDTATGAVRWTEQFTSGDAYNASCNVISLDHPNCPKPLGPDVDFGAATMLVNTPEGEPLLIAGQKSAEVHAMDPATGKRVWSKRLGRGGIIGGVHWGMAANESLGLVFVPISDKGLDEYPSPGIAEPGLYALDISSGEQRWRYRRAHRCEGKACEYGLSAAAIAANDIVVAGSIDGFLDIVHATTGELLWSHDAWRDYDAVNGTARGGGFDAHGPMLADDLLIVSSGYAYVGEQRPGNALLVFQLDADNE